MTSEGTINQFDLCDECGGPLKPEARLWGLCPRCEATLSPSDADEHES